MVGVISSDYHEEMDCYYTKWSEKLCLEPRMFTRGSLVSTP